MINLTKKLVMSIERLPDFIVIGAAKSGTTALHRMLRLVPGVCLSQKKELEYFSRDDHYKLGSDWYASFFSEANSSDIIGEISPQYSMSPKFDDVPKRMYGLIPNVKIIYVVREPVERLYSHFKQNIKVSQRLGENYITDPQYTTHMNSFDEFLKHNDWVLAISDYMYQINCFLKVYPSSQILVLLMDDLRREPRKFVGEILRFIGMENRDISRYEIEAVKANVGSDHIKMFTRGKTTESIRKIPGMNTLRSILPQASKDYLYAMLEKTRFAEKIKDRYSPPVLHSSTHEELKNYYRKSVLELEEYLDRKLVDWDY